MRIHIGCGNLKHHDSIGLDYAFTEGVDCCIAPDEPLPFPDNSVDLLIAEHVLQYSADLLASLAEIYRICKHKAKVCITGPYATTSRHMTNPRFRHLFNEHSPRYFTSSAYTILPHEEFAYTPEEHWGLADDDTLLDFRLVGITFGYFPEYLPPLVDDVEARQARRTFLNVADWIMFHLVAVKETIAWEELDRIANQGSFEVPPRIQMRLDAMTCMNRWEAEEM